MPTSDRPNILFTEPEIKQAIDHISSEVHIWTQELRIEKFHVISILEGARPFTQDLLSGLHQKTPQLQIEVHEIRVQGTNGTDLLTERHLRTGLPDIKDKNPILIVDDLIDSGLTLKLLQNELKALQAGPVKTAVLIRKFGKASGPVDFCGFELNWSHEKLAAQGLKDCWLYGYGMDLNGHQRDLKHIARIEIK